MNRREFLGAAAASVAALSLRGDLLRAASVGKASSLPRWRGFNLLEKFNARRHSRFKEEDFATMAEWGFDFVRLPMSYLCWAKVDDWLRMDEEVLKHIDEAVELGRKYRIHVNLNFHRAPGYCVNPPAEPLDLWTDPEAQNACAFHWAHFAKRYKGIPSEQLSFDLVNEPKDMSEEVYGAVVRWLVQAIRAQDPNRLIIADGLKWGGSPALSLADLGIGQSTRGYQPMQISHYKASWVNGEKWAEPTWPLQLGEKDIWDRQRLIRTRIEPWKELADKGVGVHVGEWGAYQYTPHRVVLAWMRDCLELWKEAGWGWALWNLRGGFGVMDSNRTDVEYETFRGHRLDRQMLDLLRAF